MRNRVLIVEGTAHVAVGLAAEIEKAGHEAVVVHSGAAALEAIQQNYDLAAVILDLQLPDADGLTWLRDNPDVLACYPVILTTGCASLATAVDAMRIGAFDYLIKPIAGPRLTSTLAVAIEQSRARPAPRAAVPALCIQSERPSIFVGQSSEMQEVYRQIACVAKSRATVFITGESGTGKEVCAEAIHSGSDRANGAFVAINCGAIPENLLESQIFGHLKGSFTGAVSDRIGAAQAAHQGTLFLDEICEMALPLQVKLLRFLQTGTVQKVGSNRAEKVDVRILCATNRDPVREVAEHRFREDLFYRLAVVPLHMPPLRARKGDVRELAEVFLQRFAAEEGKTFNRLNTAQLAALENQPWPGNVRELQNVMRRAAVLNDGPTLPLHAFYADSQTPRSFIPHPKSKNEGPEFQESARHPDRSGDLTKALEGRTLDEIEKLAIEAAIEANSGNLSEAAKALGVSPSTLYRKRDRWQKSGLLG